MHTDGRSLSHEALESLRYGAVRLHRNGISVEVISNSLGVTRSAVHSWLKKSKEQGLRSLKSRKSTGRPPIVSERQFKELIALLRRSATEFGYSTDLWTGPRVRTLIRRKFKIEYHRKHMPRLLRRLGLILKFPERRALEQDPKAIQKWKKERFLEILEYARKKRALVFFTDECLISLIPYIGKTWARKFSKPIARVSGKKHQHIGVTAAINAQGRFTFELSRKNERFTAHVFMRFIRKLQRENQGRSIVLIADGASTHTAKAVKKFVAQNKNRLRLEILPAYSPELNPAEKPWGYVKTKKLNANQAKDKTELKKKTKAAFSALKKDKKTLISFFV